MTVPDDIREERERARGLRSRLIYHRKKGHRAPRLARAYRRSKARLAQLARQARRGERVRSRAEWGAQAPRASYAQHRPTRGVRHHTADPAAHIDTEAEEREYMRRVQRGHFNRGFTDIGYHVVIFPSGRVYQGRPYRAVGAHVQGYNTGRVGVSFAGNFEHERPTRAALDAFARLRSDLKKQGVTAWDDHRDLNPTACPGKHMWQAHPL